MMQGRCWGWKSSLRLFFLLLFFLLSIVGAKNSKKSKRVVAVTSKNKPYGLLCSLQRNPALGVDLNPSFSWIVAPSQSHFDTEQYAFQIVLYRYGVMIEDTGMRLGNQSTHVTAFQRQLQPDTTYQWEVITWSSAQEKSSPSERATFITFYGYQQPESGRAHYIQASEINTVSSKPFFYGFFRKVVPLPNLKIVDAIAYVSARTSDETLCAYKLYINGRLVSIGPGRPDDHHTNPYHTLPVAALLHPGLSNVLAIASVHGNGPQVWFRLVIRWDCSSPKDDDYSFCTNNMTTIIGSDGSWQWHSADAYYNPTPAQGGAGLRETGLENIDANNELKGWKTEVLLSSMDDSWKNASVCVECDDNNGTSPLRPAMRRPHKAHPVQITELPSQDLVAFNSKPNSTAPNTTRHYFVDFKKEFQGGVQLYVDNGIAGTTVQIVAGELWNASSQTLDIPFTFGYNFTWTLREGKQMIEQHKYMEFRYLTLAVTLPTTSNTTPELSVEGIGLRVAGWRVQAEYRPEESWFDSDNAMLNAVWELSRYTLQAGVLETYTDSNTRERRPYEADGLIAATGRLMLQRDFMWARHSHSYVFLHPTWPAEWQQMTTLIAWLDFQTTNSTALFREHESLLFRNTKAQYLDPVTGLINTSWPGARHIVGWAPYATKRTLRRSDFMFVCNAFAARGLRLLSMLSRARGNVANATVYDAMANRLQSSIVDRMWNDSTGSFCDGMCADPRVNGFTGTYTPFYSLYLGLVPPEHAPRVWATVADYTQPNKSRYGDYGAFAVQYALTDAPLFPDSRGVVEANGGGDDGEAVLNFLTKCDDNAWCTELTKFNATMTGEAFNNFNGGTRSHPWGTSAIPATVAGLAGVQQTSPGYFSFNVKPRLPRASLNRLSLRLPVLAGFIDLTISRSETNGFILQVAIPCNAKAMLCVPLSDADSLLFLDGSQVPTRVDGRHLCVSKQVGCGPNDSPRVLSTKAAPSIRTNKL